LLSEQPEGKGAVARQWRKLVDNIAIEFWDLTPCNPLQAHRRFGETLFAACSMLVFFHILLFSLKDANVFLRNVG
jgi:hypothetical protein